MNFNSVVDRALSEHLGSGLYNKKSNGKFSLFLPTTNLGELGSTPDQIEKTVVGNMARSYIEGRKDSPQQTLTFYTHRDNLRILEASKGKTQDFLRVFPDFSAIKYSGKVNYKINDTALDSAEQGEMSITITVPEVVVDDCFELLEDTAVFTSDVPEVIRIKGTGKETINVTLNPADATINAIAETTSVATASAEGNTVTITGVKSGTCVVELTTNKSGYAGWKRTILVIVAE